MQLRPVPMSVSRKIAPGGGRIALWGLALSGLSLLSGCCDPEAHIFIQNNYTVPVSVRRLPAPGNTTSQILDTVPAGKRVEISNAPTLDGDINNLQIEDAQGHALTRLSSTGTNVVCKQKTPEYIWNISVGP